MITMSESERSFNHYVKRSLSWIENNSGTDGGVHYSNKYKQIYPEVTGYLIETMDKLGNQQQWINKSCNLLYDLQDNNGALHGVDGRPYFFDTGQVLRGWLANKRKGKQGNIHIKLAIEFMLKSINENGAVGGVYSYDGVPEEINIYALAPLMKAINRYAPNENNKTKVLKSISFYTIMSNKFSLNNLSHFTGYVIDGLLEVHKNNQACLIFDKVLKTQRDDGSFPYCEGSRWTCSVGTAQLAVIAYKLGRADVGDRAVEYLQKIQEEGGGFKGSYGFGSKYFPRVEISWAVKFFLDALIWKKKYE